MGNTGRYFICMYHFISGFAGFKQLATNCYRKQLIIFCLLQLNYKRLDKSKSDLISHSLIHSLSLKKTNFYIYKSIFR